ncbi:Mur ligase family protein [Pseudolysobacter antarcticus]|uniref:Mur ligase family protein n=1 Tax=Pseudolysobacter antarcticus TaxID=2511995 RepID=UPI001F5E154F|nr:Mur ligase family protein [Pseudolysobacter antarcticus]
MLESVGEIPDATLLLAWKTRIERVRIQLGWPTGHVLWREHASGASLALSAPVDQLFTATEVNEWAWLASIAAARRETFHAPGHAAAWDDDSALHTLRAFSAAEHNPKLEVLLQTATARQLTALLDEDELSIGLGTGSMRWLLSDLPAVESIDWSGLRDIPLALITGSNGKTTTVRLLAAMARAHGRKVGYSSTDGLVIGTENIEAGDYSGPAGARAVLRHRDVELAILETARGGILRRGLGVSRAQVAVVTNISVDHFGEYGIHDLDALAEVKLVVAHTLGSSGLLVLNADDELLVRRAEKLHCAIAWFALDDNHPILLGHRERGGVTCGMRDGNLFLSNHGAAHDLGKVADMPLTFSGSATYNIANISAAVLSASALGASVATIIEVLANFGAAHSDNPGRLQHWQLGSLQVFLDYAHNAEGLRGLLDVATRQRGSSRLLLVLGQAGNREDKEIRELAQVAASFHPDHIVLKDIDGMLRGRAAGEVATILRDELVRAGLSSDAIVECLDEFTAARSALAAARAHEVLVLPIHGGNARNNTVVLLDQLLASGWQPGTDLPAA